MQVGVLGDIVFQVSWGKIVTPSNIQWDGSARHAVHQRHLQNALTEFTGRDPDKISFDIYLASIFGVDPMGAIWQLFNYERQGTPLALTIGEHGYGRYRWNIISHSTTVQDTDGEGNLIAATIRLNLQEYLRE